MWLKWPTEELLVWGRAPSRACPERSRRVQAERSSAGARGHGNAGFPVTWAADMCPESHSSSGTSRQSLKRDVIRIMRQLERGQFVTREPANIRRIAPRFEIAANCTTEEINQH